MAIFDVYEEACNSAKECNDGSVKGKKDLVMETDKKDEEDIEDVKEDTEDIPTTLDDPDDLENESGDGTDTDEWTEDGDDKEGDQMIDNPKDLATESVIGMSMFDIMMMTEGFHLETAATVANPSNYQGGPECPCGYEVDRDKAYANGITDEDITDNIEGEYGERFNGGKVDHKSIPDFAQLGTGIDDFTPEPVDDGDGAGESDGFEADDLNVYDIGYHNR